LKGYYALERCEKVLIEKETECGSANYNLEQDEKGSCEKGLLCLALSATVLRKLASCNSVQCALEQVLM
jgi:hypothetical protein